MLNTVNGNTGSIFSKSEFPKNFSVQLDKNCSELKIYESHIRASKVCKMSYKTALTKYTVVSKYLRGLLVMQRSQDHKLYHAKRLSLHRLRPEQTMMERLMT
ncbi:hypothetical protein CDL12_13635 [Handroanthus impetiginosus]|uniref:Uncharacterized protein n=1 Tax=Handroanthus impetiginosus TaxID=429701 RepID=A0A2G9H887_9LAMI|nr:hypothetical protein CDL12_13635 [Handroanthus impetiginosus]